MEKSAFYRYAGRDLGLRHAISALMEDLDKTAEVDVDLASAISDSGESLEFTDEVTKRAHNIGVITAFGQVIDQIESGVPAEKIAEQLTAAVEAKVANAYFPIPESDEEASSFQDEMVKGAAEAIGGVSGIDPASDEVLDAAIDLVAASLEVHS